MWERWRAEWMIRRHNILHLCSVNELEAGDAPAVTVAYVDMSITAALALHFLQAVDKHMGLNSNHPSACS